MIELVNKKFMFDGVTWDIWIYKSDCFNAVYEAYTIAELLGYEHPDVAIKNHVDPSCCKKWEDLECAAAEHKQMCIFQKVPLPKNIKNAPKHWHSNTVFINEAGVISLIMNSVISYAEKFKEWFYEELFCKNCQKHFTMEKNWKHFINSCLQERNNNIDDEDDALHQILELIDDEETNREAALIFECINLLQTDDEEKETERVAARIFECINKLKECKPK
ncbi:hypothetical protein PsunGV_gp062 [Pseudalatia unipuncta granulovirus]|uniref:Bro-N domain-containing protein n=1 Tax=Pseudalatia unipuncta granulosis virus TaxID=36355 RepID=B6S6T1_GVPU|nr:hypothetical protein PsunGV_gp062 [Pseudalatia unipuncta granulovirus]ACH69412.1 unknown [Pseudalatia unipuncta granulovirus]